MDTRNAIHALSCSVDIVIRITYRDTLVTICIAIRIAILRSRYNTRITGPSIAMHRCIVTTLHETELKAPVACSTKIIHSSWNRSARRPAHVLPVDMCSPLIGDNAFRERVVLNGSRIFIQRTCLLYGSRITIRSHMLPRLFTHKSRTLSLVGSSDRKMNLETEIPVMTHCKEPALTSKMTPTFF